MQTEELKQEQPTTAVDAQETITTTEETTKLVAEEYKDLGEYEAKVTPVPVDKKNVPIASYGHRIRIGKLFDSHEEFMYKIIQVAGWARTVRGGGKDFSFIELHDGSSLKGLQVRNNILANYTPLGGCD